MSHLPGLINDLALILMTAGVVTLVFRKLKQPVVLGYLLAGFLVGPHFLHVPTVTDQPNVQIWSEIGIIFLLFALGLEFSFKKLAKVGGAAGVTAVIEVVGMIGVGFVAGKALGWNTMDSLFLGAILSMSSTTIIIRAFEEVGVKGRGFVSLVFGVLIVEDIIAILLLVLLGTVAVTKSFAGTEMLYSAGKLIFFLTLWFLAGIYFVPSFLRRAKPWINQETLLIMSIGLCFAMVVFATKVGFSSALGAFVMGSILAETVEAERIEHVIGPVKDLFAAVFFISVGMLINPDILVQYAGPIAIITLVTIIGKLMTTTLGALVAGRSVRHSIQAGFSLAQIGEFSFIIAGLGLSLKVTSEFLYPIAVSVSAVTTFCTPYLIKHSDKSADKIEAMLPESWKNALAHYARNTGSVASTSEWSTLVRSYASAVFIFGILVSAIFLFIGKVLPTLVTFDERIEGLREALSFVAALALAAPFLWAMAIRRPRAELIASLWTNHRARVPLAVLEISRVLIAAALIGILSSEALSLNFALTSTIAFCAILVFAFSRNLNALYQVIEKRFVANLSERETMSNEPAPALAPWDAHVVWFDIPPNSTVAGLSIGELGIRSTFGVTIAAIERGDRRLLAPNFEERIFPHDRLAVLGTDEQLSEFRKQIETEHAFEADEIEATHYALRQVELRETSPLIGKTVRDSEIRTRTKGLLVGLERQGQRILNPESSTVFKPGDHLWIVGDPNSIRSLGG
jgi:CPA2 family monovalent cation:H+ antiporter-2